MKCPLFHAANMTHEERLLNDPEDCLKEDCAWWDRANTGCFCLGLYGELITLNGHLEDLIDKIPHEKQ